MKLFLAFIFGLVLWPTFLEASPSEGVQVKRKFNVEYHYDLKALERFPDMDGKIDAISVHLKELFKKKNAPDICPNTAGKTHFNGRLSPVIRRRSKDKDIL